MPRRNNVEKNDTENKEVSKVKIIDTNNQVNRNTNNNQNRRTRRNRRDRRSNRNMKTRIVYSVTRRVSKSKKMRSVPVVYSRRVKVPAVSKNRVRRVRSRNINSDEPEENKKGCGCGR